MPVNIADDHCMVCFERHRTIKCPIFVSWGYIIAVQFLKDRNLCIYCGGCSHLIQNCNELAEAEAAMEMGEDDYQ